MAPSDAAIAAIGDLVTGEARATTPSMPGAMDPPLQTTLTSLIAEVTSELHQLRLVFENRIDTPFFDIEGAARFLRISPASLEYLSKRERRLPYHVVGRQLVFHRDDLLKFMETRRRPGIDG